MQPSEPAGDATCPHCGSLMWCGEPPNLVIVTVIEFGDEIGDEAARKAFCVRVEELIEAGRPHVLLDLSQARSLPESILGLLVHLHLRVEVHGGRVALCGVAPELVQLFKITRVDRLLRIYHNQADALRRWFDA